MPIWGHLSWSLHLTPPPPDRWLSERALGSTLTHSTPSHNHGLATEYYYYQLSLDLYRQQILPL